MNIVTETTKAYLYLQSVEADGDIEIISVQPGSISVKGVTPGIKHILSAYIDAIWNVNLL